MTVAVSANSARRQAAERFGAELSRAMRTRKIGRRRLAELLHMQSASIVAHWRSGGGIPRVENAARVAEALDWPALLEIAQSVRELPCDQCGRMFVNEGGGPKRYCSEICRERKARARLLTGTPEKRADRAERALGDHRAAVEAMCRACEPEGLCRRETCALRPVSPLPLVTPRRVSLAADVYPVRRPQPHNTGR